MSYNPTVPSKANMRAFENTVYSYEMAIWRLEAGDPVCDVIRSWGSYGDIEVCLLCIASYTCDDCCINHCVSSNRSGHGLDTEVTFTNLIDAIHEADEFTRSKLIQAFKDRLANLIAVAEANGVILEEVE
jgi:hypothetical protein